MTTHSLIKFERVNAGGGHAYRLDGHKIPGVTTIMSNGIPKNLAKWGAESAAASVLNDWEKLQSLTPSARYKYISDSPWRDLNRAGIKGSRVHLLAEKLVNGETVAVPKDIKGYVEAAALFLKEWNVRKLYAELPVVNVTYGYAGTSDLIAELVDGRVWLCDWKTSASGLWPDVAFQLSAYRHAEYALDLDTGEVFPMPEIQATGGIHLCADGTYDFHELESGGDVLAEFLAIKKTGEAVANARDGYMSGPLFSARHDGIDGSGMTDTYDGPPICQLDDSGIVRVPPTQGQYAVIDADDWPLVADYAWYAKWSDCTNSYYAATNVPNPPWGRRTLRMHELIAGKSADHVNHDTLDDRRSNLRPATMDHENNWNQDLRSDNTSGFKGVIWDKRAEKWLVRIAYHGVRVHLGYFDDKIDAARAYDRAAIEYFGEFSRTNVMLGLLPPESPE